MHHRPRRNRINETVRSLVRETELLPAHLIQPLFLMPGTGVRTEVSSLPGSFRLSVDQAIPFIAECIKYGVKSFILFPAIPENHKDSHASFSWDDDNYYLSAIYTFKREFPDAIFISDVAMDPYSSDGHDGLVRNGEIVNDDSLPILAKMAVAQARAGIDIVGPSDMMDGRVGYIRQALDEAGFVNVGIMAYTVKYASAFYGPFRDALDSAPKAGDKKTYQMDPANRREALREFILDEQEGADMVMVKPALHYLDVISDLKEISKIPVVAYHVSGECAMLLAACQNGWLNFEKAMPETLTSIRRAGADIIITYLALDYAKWWNRA